MAYTPTNWVEGVTTLGPTNMNKIETELAYLDGAVLNATDLNYHGDYAAGSYKDGDIVVYGGISYVCVRPTSAAPTPWPPSPSAPTYSTTLPSNPVDGQEAVLVDSVTNPSYTWRFRYNAGSSSAYKWEFIGGIPAVASVATDESSGTTGAWIDLATVGPQFAVPRAGDYFVTGSAVMYSTVQTILQLGITKNAGSPIFPAYTQAIVAAGYWANPTITGAVITAFAASDNARMRYQANASTWHAWYRELTALPVRVS